MFYGLDGDGVFSMDPSAEDREPGIPLENAEEESIDPSCTGENSKYVSNLTEKLSKYCGMALYLRCDGDRFILSCSKVLSPVTSELNVH